MRAYSMDLRERVLADCDAGAATAAVARKFRVSESWVRRLKHRRAATGETAPRAGRAGPKPSWGAYADRLRGAVRQAPDATLAELKARLGLAVALSTLWRAGAALGLTVKEKSPGRLSRTGPTSARRVTPGGPRRRGSTRRS
jgi:transposase